MQALFEPNSDQNRGVPVAIPVSSPVILDDAEVESGPLPESIPGTNTTIVPLPKNPDRKKK